MFLLICAIFPQPNISGLVGIGYASPDYQSFAKSPFPSQGVFEKMMLHFAFDYQFYPNARIGFNQWSAAKSDKYQGQDFKRSFTYHALVLETFFFIRKRMELNFSLGPMINTGKITIASSQSAAVWDSLIAEFNNTSIPISSKDKMTKLFFGFTSSVGFRFYLNTYLALDGKIGFMSNYYKNDRWKFQGKSIKGPDVKLNDLPLFSFGLVYGW